jgi:hypothetical protein
MKKKLLSTALVLIGLTLGTVKTNAQATIGSDEAPEKGSLLELKNEKADDPHSTTDIKNVTSTYGGLGLPRVYLENKNTLMPFIPADSDWNSDKDNVKEKHTGLTVYNIRESLPTDPENTRFSEGIYVWDGLQWKETGNPKNEKIFRMPIFKLPLHAGQTLTFNLYEEYKRQFTQPVFFSENALASVVPSPDANHVYAETDLDYVVTYYDDTLIKVIDIDQNGIMTYEVLPTADLSNDLLLNIVLIVNN